MTISIRKAEAGDAPSLSRICLLTGDAGQSAEHLHDFPELPGIVYAVPYVKLATTFGFVLDDDSQVNGQRVVGYILGTTDTRRFEQIASAEWWPVQQAKYPPSLGGKAADQRYMNLLGNMHTAPEVSIAFSPTSSSSHVHIDLLPVVQRQGFGKKLMDTAVEYLSAHGHKSVFVGLDPRNLSARAFYAKLGFEVIQGSDGNQMGLRW